MFPKLWENFWVSNYLLFMKGCAVCWVTHRLEGSVTVTSGLQAAWPRNLVQIPAGEQIFYAGCVWGPPSFMFMCHMGCSGYGKKATSLVCLVPRWVCGPVLQLLHMASLYGTWLSTWKALYSKYYHVYELSKQWWCFGFSQCTACLILSSQRSKLPPSSGSFNVKVMTSFKHQFWLCCLVGLTQCLAVNNLTYRWGFTTRIQIVFWQSLYIKRFKNIQGQYICDNSQHSSLRPFHLPLHPGSRCHTTLLTRYRRHATTAQCQANNLQSYKQFQLCVQVKYLVQTVDWPFFLHYWPSIYNAKANIIIEYFLLLNSDKWENFHSMLIILLTSIDFNKDGDCIYKKWLCHLSPLYIDNSDLLVCLCLMALAANVMQMRNACG